MNIIFKLILSLAVGILFLYLIYCLFLNMIAMPDDRDSNLTYRFIEKPKGFIKFSRIIGAIFIWLLIICIITGSTFIALFCN